MRELIYKLIPDFLKISYYKLRGKKPWSLGYTTFKLKFIKEAIKNQEIIEKFKSSNQLPEKYGYALDERIIEYPWVISKIPPEGGNFMDAGSALNRKEILEQSIFKNKKITIFNLNPESNCFWQMGISYVFGDLRQIPFRDNYFDCVTCLSTLEHIGMDNTLYLKDQKYKEKKTSDFLTAVSEIKRVLRSGGRALITVPFGKYQNLGWFQQFDSALVNKIPETFQPAGKSIYYYKYGEEGWELSDETSCGNAEYLSISGSGSAQAVACLELVK